MGGLAGDLVRLGRALERGQDADPVRDATTAHQHADKKSPPQGDSKRRSPWATRRTITKKNRLGSSPCEYFPLQRGKYGKGVDCRLRMEVREQNKIVELWLTREERDDAAFRESLKPHLPAVQGIRTIWWRSSCPGRQNLYQQTRDLLLYNRRRLAEKESSGGEAGAGWRWAL